MKFTLSWLRDHLETTKSVDEICVALNSIGLEVESVEDPAKTLGAFRIARILTASQHPNADRLQVCQVNAGEGFENVQVVCGAPNARAGLVTIFAPVGTYVPGSDITLKAGKIRGEQSNGMMCSTEELGLGEKQDGIMELPEEAPVGTAYVDFAKLNDPVIEIAITPNRGDALSIRNIARDLAAAGMGTLKPWNPEVIEGTFPSEITWDNQFTEACPWVLGRTITNVKNGSSPEWLQARLRAVGVRPISLLVDITNFFTFDLGRPLHVFDVDKITGKTLTICPGQGEKLIALDGKEYQVTDKDCVIADQSGVQSLAGLIGGEHTGVTEETTTVFIECALFNPATIALSGRRHFITTDARQRFERGVDQALLPDAMEAATQMILDLCGGKPSEVVVAGEEPKWKRDATLRYNSLENFGGLVVAPERVTEILTSLGFEVKDLDSQAVTVSVPSWRNDIVMPMNMAQHSSIDAGKADQLTIIAQAMEGEIDLIEEVLRIEGLDCVPAVSLPVTKAVPEAALTSSQENSILCARLLAARGLVETVGFSFVDHEIAARLGDAPENLRLLNPISSDMDQLRPTPLASLLPTLQRNIVRGWGNIAFFEVGPAFTQDAEKTVAAGVRYGYMPRNIQGKAQEVTLWDVKADVYFALDGLGVAVDSLQITKEIPIYYHPGRSGRLSLGPKNTLAYFGELHPSLVKEFGFDQAPMIFEIMVDNLIAKKAQKKKIPYLSSFQPLKRDFAFVVKSDVEVGKILNAAKQSDRQLLTNVELFDVYVGEKIAEGHKSVAIQVTLQPQDRNLKDEEIEVISQKIIKEVGRLTGGTLR
ncbi:Phenylalanyl-tRNA synthetase beta subunit (PheT) (PDB:3L4G) [Commensalibacter communis]|uniref:phenylalanine--tRNA ligase subunit beta n=1 Tax=Commensalibacter communis TaxID=2972786 RepID=UPI0022FF5CA8|nr:phenylalanine--tRNA ligase subunit beta [Commensalibacter communis]CAI3926627.1 Phenylalanyl-tRNA synthetase beta subunit (PheT) (PDB:3L4G) [Commensalibacter communis]CAI3932535.1 Phenylalanyl-tRNA synthetase beta subunit (PheT) (PDB:3L4G) [Commensalibacter communis]